jgi:hypothetical protein
MIKELSLVKVPGMINSFPFSVLRTAISPTFFGGTADQTPNFPSFSLVSLQPMVL